MKKDLGVFDHLRFFLVATAAPFFILFFPTRLLGASALGLIGFLGVSISATILILYYFAWGHDTLPRNRLKRGEILLGAVIGSGIHFLFLSGIWVLLFIVKVHWHFSTVYLAATAFPPLSLFLKLWGVGREFFSDERVIPLFISVLFFLMALAICACFVLTAAVAYEMGVRADVRETEMQKRGEMIVRKSFAKRMIFVPFLNLGSFFPWILRHMIHPEAKLREIFPPCLVMMFSGIGYSFLVMIIDSFLQSAFLYYFLCFLGIYLLGMFLSFVELIDEKKYSFLE